MVKSTLRRKLIRDMWQNRMQFAAIICLCALGTWVFSGLDAAWRMLELSSDTYFARCNTADFWISMNGADRGALRKLCAQEGIADAQVRASAELKADLPHEPTLALEAYDGEIRINAPYMITGEPLNASDTRGCLLDDAFAKANGLATGDRLTIKLGAMRYIFTIRGTCLSGEFSSLTVGTVLDPLNYGFVLLNSAGFSVLPLNELVACLTPGADTDGVQRVIETLFPEALVLSRDAQRSTHGVVSDGDMYRNLSYVFPLLAYAVAAMIVLTTITRMLENQRMQMGTLKALGYRDGQMLRHYLCYALYPSLIGSFIGLFAGRVTLPYLLWDMETTMFNLPLCMQAPISWMQWTMCGLGTALSCAICLRTYRKTAREQTAALLRPKPPKAGRKLLLERAGGLWRRLSFNAKMTVRNLFRNKARTLMSLIGSLCCTMLIMTSLGLQDSVEYFVSKYYDHAIQYTLEAVLTGAADDADAYRKRIQAERVEGVMVKPINVRFGDDVQTTTLQVMEDDQRLMNLGENETWVPLPEKGVMITRKLAEALNIGIGDEIRLSLPGDTEPITDTVTAIAYITIGQTAFVRRSVWDGYLKGEFEPTSLYVRQPTVMGLRTLNDLAELDELKYPQIQEQDTLKILDSVRTIFGVMSGAALGLAFVIIYNMGILNFAERYREYATLKVLGYHQKEIRRLMVAESCLVSALGVLMGIWPGHVLTDVVLTSCENDSMVFASTVTLTSTLIACVVTFAFSYLITRLLTLKVKRIDMVEALKSVE